MSCLIQCSVQERNKHLEKSQKTREDQLNSDIEMVKPVSDLQSVSS